MIPEIHNLDEQTIAEIGLILTDKPLLPEAALKARVFEYPHLKDVYIMECDLYGNQMPEGSIFLAFYGVHGMIGEHLKIETLKNSTPEDIRRRVEKDRKG